MKIQTPASVGRSASRRAAACAGILVLGLLALVGCDTSEGVRKGAVIDARDPIVQDFPIAFVRRPLPLSETGASFEDDLLEPVSFNPGAQLILKDRASASAPETILTAGVFPPGPEGEAAYDVRDLSVSGDGKRLLFAMRAPEIENADDDEQPTWNIWEYALDEARLRRVIGSDLVAEQGQDLAPRYTTDGRIAFVSDRQRRSRAIQLDEGKPQYAGLDEDLRNQALVLHVMDTDGDNIEQISFNPSHDQQPTVLNSGAIAYLRWDNIAGNDVLSLYKLNPDGTENQPYFGYHSQATGSDGSAAVLTQTQTTEDGLLVGILRARQTTRLGGDIVAFDPQGFFDADTAIDGDVGSVGQWSLSAGNVLTHDQGVSLGGTFSSVYPLYDGTDRLLVSWSQCRLLHPDTGKIAPCTEALLARDAAPAPLLFGLWITDPDTRTQLPVKIPEEGVMFTNAVVMVPRTPPDFYAPAPNDTLAEAALGVVHIRSIYDRDGQDTSREGIEAMRDPAQTSPELIEARFIRIIKAVPMPDDSVRDFDRAAFGASRGQLMRDIIGYVPIEPDGSAKFKLPAEIPVMLDLVDAAGKRIGGRHQNWFSVMPGEQRECAGCHSRDSKAPHGRLDAGAESANPGAVGGRAFANTRLLDDFGIRQPPPLTGQSMAEYRADVQGEARSPSVDLLYTDDWTDPARATPASDIVARFIDIQTALVSPESDDMPAQSRNPRDADCPPLAAPPALWQAPSECLAPGSWNSQCRITINYETSIHPLWEADRRECDTLGNLVSDHTCVSCHTAGAGAMVQIPAGQLELTGATSVDRNAYITSYAELMFSDIEQDLVDNSLINLNREIPTGEFETDADGELILDEDGNPIEIVLLEPIRLPVPMSANGARSSNRFFNRFAAGGSHEGYLSSAELKLIAEWLDIGAQYYNNPFDAPAD